MGRERRLRLAFPHGWRYDVGRAPDLLRRTRAAPDERMWEALEPIAAKRDDDGRWRLEMRHHDRLPVDLGADEGTPSRWVSLLALRVLRWADPTSPPPAGATA